MNYTQPSSTSCCFTGNRKWSRRSFRQLTYPSHQHQRSCLAPSGHCRCNAWTGHWPLNLWTTLQLALQNSLPSDQSSLRYHFSLLLWNIWHIWIQFGCEVEKHSLQDRSQSLTHLFLLWGWFTLRWETDTWGCGSRYKLQADIWPKL